MALRINENLFLLNIGKTTPTSFGNTFLISLLNCSTVTKFFWVIATTASVSIAWGYLFNKDLGVFNWALKELGIITEGIPWLTSSKYAMISIVIFSIWKFSGLHFLYYLIEFWHLYSSSLEKYTFPPIRLSPWYYI